MTFGTANSTQAGKRYARRPQGVSMRGVQFLVETAVLIDLKKNAQLWEDFCDVAVAKSREREPRESLQSVKRRLGLTRKRR